MDAELRWIAAAAGAERARKGERIQSLWGGYGEIVRVHLTGARIRAGSDRASVIVKRVEPPARSRSDSASHRRKVRSYHVETTWYRTLARRCDDACRVPRLLDAKVTGERGLLVLEDLDAAGFAERRRRPTSAELASCLAWLASFHARFLGVAPEGLWKVGTYWHLATRRGELAVIADAALRSAAPTLDRRLRDAAFQTLVHGDPKPANFCFAPGGRAVAAVDFQYVGGGCGMKDVAYLLAGPDAYDSQDEERQLDGYFAHLRRALVARGAGGDADALEREWRSLYPLACADYYRFLAGWAPGHWRGQTHGQRVVRDVLRTLA